jgi:lipopolysaccharide biosynthesis glycosyltransferase
MQIQVYVGYDPRESVAYHVCCHSVLARTKAQVSFTPVCGSMDDASNTFSKARFLVPYMQGFRGKAIWLDGDMLCRADIAELYGQLEHGCDVAVVQHNYSTKHPVKYLGQRNDDYPRKNWSSVMVMDCGNYPWRKLTPEYVSKSTGAHLHRFEFLKDERIGDLDKDWNHLVSEYEPNPQAKIAHFTIGIPSFYPRCEFAAEWWNELKAMTYHEHWDDTKLVSER